jgi:DNA-binding response OmpR family regulator
MVPPSGKASQATGASWPRSVPTSLPAMTEVLIATDADAVFAEVEAALVDESTTIRRVRSGQAVAAAVADSTPDLVVLDLQIGNMGGIATCLHLHHEAGAGRLPEVPVLLLLDREVDAFLARRSGADGWVVKPLDAFSLRKAATAILESERVPEVNPA